MPKRWLFAFSCLLAAAFVSSAAATIVVQRGIAGISIGMSQKKVRAVLGKPTKAFKSKNAFGIYVEYRYRKLVLDFQGPGPLSNISTTRRSERTSTGVGVGSTMAQVQTKVPGAHCKVQLCSVGNALPGKIVTTFYLRMGKVTQVSVGRVID
jgi:hypothetical protein